MVGDDSSEYAALVPVCITSGVFKVVTPFSPNHSFGVPSEALREYSPPVAVPNMIDGGRGSAPPPPGQ